MLAGAVVLASLNVRADARADRREQAATFAPSVQASTSSSAGEAAISSLDSRLPREVEPNDSAATANDMGLVNDQAQMQGTIGTIGDVDYFRFVAQPGDILYAATNNISATNIGIGDTYLEVIGPDGATVIASDDNNGSANDFSSVLAGVDLLEGGTYYLRVTESGNDGLVLPYRLYLQLRRGMPANEVEPNNGTNLVMQDLGDIRWIEGNSQPGQADPDGFSLDLNAGDTFVAILDRQPHGVTLARSIKMEIGRLVADGVLLSTSTSVNDGNLPAGELAFTARDSGRYYILLSSNNLNLARGRNYQLSITVFPAPTPLPGMRCTTFSGPVTPIVDAGEVIVPIDVNLIDPGLVDDVDLDLEVVDSSAHDLDLSLRSPSGTEVLLFHDFLSTGTGVFVSGLMLTFDDEAAFTTNTILSTNIPPQTRFSQLAPLDSRLSWFDGTPANGTWQLMVRDDSVGGLVGAVQSAKLTICERPPEPQCPTGTAPYTVYDSASFEGGNVGFTHVGSQDQWALGQPSGSAIASCATGNACWKTNLTGNYAASSVQNLLSPPIDLRLVTGPLYARWSQAYQMDTVLNDHFYVDAELVGGATTSRLFEHLDQAMTASLGVGPTVVDTVAGWSRQSARIDEFAGLPVRLRFHLDSDAATEFAGAAIDDVSIVGCRSTTQADTSITISDGATSIHVPGGVVTYNIVANNAGPADTTAEIIVNFGDTAQCTWTATFDPGASGPSSGSGPIDVGMYMPLNSNVYIVATCQFPLLQSGTTTTMASIATVDPVADTQQANNVATDINTFIPANETVFSDGFE